MKSMAGVNRQSEVGVPEAGASPEAEPATLPNGGYNVGPGYRVERNWPTYVVTDGGSELPLYMGLWHEATAQGLADFANNPPDEPEPGRPMGGRVGEFLVARFSRNA
jgi:hypothetical protein